MQNLAFLLINKLLSSQLQNAIGPSTPGQEAFLKRVKLEKAVDSYKLITFTILKETDLFFNSVKS